MLPWMLDKTSNVIPQEQCILSAFGLRMTLFPQGYMGHVAQLTGQHLYNVNVKLMLCMCVVFVCVRMFVMYVRVLWRGRCCIIVKPNPF